MIVNSKNAESVIDHFNTVIASSIVKYKFEPILIEINDFKNIINNEDYLLYSFHFVVNTNNQLNLLLRKTNRPIANYDFDNSDQFYEIVDQKFVLSRFDNITFNEQLATFKDLNTEISRLTLDSKQNTTCVSHDAYSMQICNQFSEQLEESLDPITHFKIEFALLHDTMPEQNDALNYFAQIMKNRVTFIGSYATKNNNNILPMDIGHLTP